MLLAIPDVLSPEQVKQCLEVLGRAEWVDGRVTAGHQSGQAKENLQVAEGDEAGRQMGEAIVGALERNATFMSAALPLKVYPPLFNRYREGGSFGTHVDNAVRQVTGTPYRVRTDLSATLFLSEPEGYEGGELVVEDTYGVHEVKLGAGHLILYPASSLHRVRAVTRGERVASFFWVQSMVRDDLKRGMLYELDVAVQRVSQEMPGHASAVELTGLYHNLLRMWADV